ncbi:ribbon-helix-helix domain-containing protein [Methylomonas rhizoryzae]|uniref:ribbon-helix-helix domain-containing protein n=1 Tax=Methylomonas rhizoryzae TaxID=2608981 RepID=UPI001232661C|nr:CopG family transcriptional regulator [Methylomonas rhizoryzae]
MMTLELDDETADVLNQLATEQHLSPAQLVKSALLAYLEDCQDSKRAEAAYQAYLDGGKVYR